MPTVSIQNGRAICTEISRDSALSSSEKKGFGKAGGNPSPRMISMSRPSRFDATGASRSSISGRGSAW